MKEWEQFQSVPKTFWQTSPNSILEEFFGLSKFYAIFTSPNQFLLDLGLGLAVFGADCNLVVFYYIKASKI
jgi:hypothetical protein